MVHTSLFIQIRAIALFTFVDIAVTTFSAVAGVELAIRGTAKRTAIEALGFTRLLIQIRAVALFIFVDITITTFSAAGGVELAILGAAKSAAVEALGFT